MSVIVDSQLFLFTTERNLAIEASNIEGINLNFYVNKSSKKISHIQLELQVTDCAL